MKIENISSIAEYVYGELEKRFFEIFETEFESDFKKIKDAGIEIGVTVTDPTLELFTDSFRYHKGHMTRKWVVEQFLRQSHKQMTSCESAYVVYNTTSDNMVQITNMTLSFKQIYMDREIIDVFFLDPDKFKARMDLVFHHEIGHFLDYMRFNGKPVEEFDDYFDADNKMKDEHYKWMADNKWTVNEAERMKRYYTLPLESMANNLGHVDLDDLIRLEYEVSNEFRKNKDYTIEINVKVNDKPNKEEEK